MELARLEPCGLIHRATAPSPAPRFSNDCSPRLRNQGASCFTSIGTEVGTSGSPSRTLSSGVSGSPACCFRFSRIGGTLEACGRRFGSQMLHGPAPSSDAIPSGSTRTSSLPSMSPATSSWRSIRRGIMPATSPSWLRSAPATSVRRCLRAGMPGSAKGGSARRTASPKRSSASRARTSFVTSSSNSRSPALRRDPGSSLLSGTWARGHSCPAELDPSRSARGAPSVFPHLPCAARATRTVSARPARSASERSSTCGNPNGSGEQADGKSGRTV